MLQLCRDLDLLEEAFRTEYGSEFGTQDLYSHLAVVLQVFREIDRSHATRTKLSLDPVAVRQRSFQAIQLVCHGYGPQMATRLKYALGLETARLGCGVDPQGVDEVLWPLLQHSRLIRRRRSAIHDSDSRGATRLVANESPILAFLLAVIDRIHEKAKLATNRSVDVPDDTGTKQTDYQV